MQGAGSGWLPLRPAGISGDWHVQSYISRMIVPSERLGEFEKSYLRNVLRDMTYPRALEIFTALWVEARHLNPDLGADWRDDVEPALAVARTLNGLQPGA